MTQLTDLQVSLKEHQVARKAIDLCPDFQALPPSLRCIQLPISDLDGVRKLLKDGAHLVDLEEILAEFPQSNLGKFHSTASFTHKTSHWRTHSIDCTSSQVAGRRLAKEPCGTIAREANRWRFGRNMRSMKIRWRFGRCAK